MVQKKGKKVKRYKKDYKVYYSFLVNKFGTHLLLPTNFFP